MALSSSYNIVVDGVTITLRRISDSLNQSTYFAEDETRKFTMSVNHTIPQAGKSGESHLLRLDVDHHDLATGAYLRRSSVWTVIKTFDNVQVSAQAEDNALGFLALAEILAPALVARES